MGMYCVGEGLQQAHGAGMEWFLSTALSAVVSLGWIMIRCLHWTRSAKNPSEFLLLLIFFFSALRLDHFLVAFVLFVLFCFVLFACLFVFCNGLLFQ